MTKPIYTPVLAYTSRDITTIFCSKTYSRPTDAIRGAKRYIKKNNITNVNGFAIIKSAYTKTNSWTTSEVLHCCSPIINKDTIIMEDVNTGDFKVYKFNY